mmetsp:Transcript_2449/g.3570  ORF Transcript_2449/g.3570 Transcript_2449/m.3570 type:complete len:420 (+) Transcript_2449:122-1381(+)
MSDRRYNFQSFSKPKLPGPNLQRKVSRPVSAQNIVLQRRGSLHTISRPTSQHGRRPMPLKHYSQCSQSSISLLQMPKEFDKSNTIDCTIGALRRMESHSELRAWKRKAEKLQEELDRCKKEKNQRQMLEETLRLKNRELTERLKVLTDENEKIASENAWEMRTALRQLQSWRDEYGVMEYRLKCEQKKAVGYHSQLRKARKDLQQLEHKYDLQSQHIKELKAQVASIGVPPLGVSLDSKCRAQHSIESRQSVAESDRTEKMEDEKMDETSTNVYSRDSPNDNKNTPQALSNKPRLKSAPKHEKLRSRLGDPLPLHTGTVENSRFQKPSSVEKCGNAEKEDTTKKEDSAENGDLGAQLGLKLNLGKTQRVPSMIGSAFRNAANLNPYAPTHVDDADESEYQERGDVDGKSSASLLFTPKP